MCDCFHLAFPNWHAASSGTGPGRRLRAPEPGTEDDSTCDDPSEFTERPRPQGSSPVEEYPETEKYTDSDKECEAEHDPHHKTGSGKKSRKSGLGSMFEKRSTPKMSKLKEVHSPESGVIVKTAKDGCAEGLVYGGGGKEGIFIKEVVPESPASKSLKLKEGDQVLSATVYFDNVSYEDAIQILEHAQAYKVKLCLKRKPDIAETEPAIDSDVIPEEDVYAPEMREQGKTKRRGDARISWPKFPSFGKGKKSRFTRSHSSSEADEQRKLELSPTTSDTESPIKSQDALKGKKKHKIKLSVMTKRGRVSSSEDTDAPTSAQMLSPEGLESPSRESPQVYVTEDLKVGEASQEPSEPRPAQHKVELISLDSTLKTEDLTVALAGQEGSSDLKSPDGKKKRSELKMKILGKDKAHKKAKSPKRLKTLGASIEQADQADTKTTTQMEMTLPKVELEISDAALIQKSPQKGEDKTKKGKDGKHKQETDATFKLPKVGFGDITSEEAIPKMNVNVGEPTVKIEQLTTEGTAAKDPYERLSKSDKLPKREDIEIPGMEDMSKKTKGKGIKEPKAVFTGHYEKMQADTVQMSIDVDSVKEAVSKLPGFKLPKIDTSGVPIPEEITVIDANAQRISVKTPTKIKHEEHSGKFDVTSSPDKFKTTFKLPTIAADLSSEELLMVTQADKDYYKRDKIIIPGKESAQEVTSLQTQEGGEAIESEYKSAATFKSKRAKIVMPSFGVGKPDIRIPDVGIYLPKQHSSEQKGGHIKGERTIFIQEEDEIPKTDTKYLIEGVVSDIKMPEIDGIEYIDSIDSVDGSPANGSIRRTGENLDGASPKVDYTFQDIGGEIYINDANKDLIIEGAALKSPEREGKGIKFKLPSLGISRPKVKGPKIDLSLSKKDGDVTLLEAKAEAELPEIPEVELEKPELEIKAGRVEGELDGHGNKFKKPKFGIKIPKLKGPEFDSSKKEIEVKLPQYEVKHPEAPEIDVTLRAGDVSISGQKLEIDKPELEVKPLRIEGELDGQGSKFKMPELGVKMPKMKRSEFDLSLSKKDVDITLPQVKADVKLPDVEYKEPGIKIEGPEISAGSIGTPHVSVEVSDMDKDVKFDGIDIKAPSVNVEGPSIDMRAEGKGSKFKMPHLGFSMPKVKGPQFSSSKKDIDVALPEITVEAKGPKIDATLGKAEVLIPDVEVKKPEVKIQPLQTDVELEAQGGKFQMPKFGITMPKLKGPEIHMGVSKKDGEVTLPEATIEGKTPKVDVSLGKVDVSLPEGKMEVKKPELEIEPLEGEVDIDGQKSNFKMPRLGMSMPKVKGPEFHFGLSRKDGDVTSPEAKVEVPECDIKGPSAQVEIKSPEIKIEAKGKDGSPSKFKMPTFKLPKFGVTSPNVSVDVPDMDKDVKISGADVDIPDKVHITAPSVDIEGPLIDVKTTGAEGDGKGGKFKMPNLSFSMPKMKGSKKDMDIKLPEVDLGKVDVTIPEAKIEVKEPEIEMQLQSEGKLDGQGEKFKMPKFGMSMPKVKGPEFHLGLSQKDVDVTLPEVKADVNLPDVELKKPSAEVEIKAPGIEVETKDAEASSKFKMPNLSFSMPKIKGPDIDLSLTKKDTGIKADIELPEAPKMEASLGKAEVEIPEAKIEVKKPEVVVKPLQTDVKIEGHKSKFQMPKFGVSMPKVKAPELDLSFSKKDVDVNLPDIKAKVELPEDPKIAVDMKTPKCEGEIDFSKKDFNVTLPEVKAEVNLPEIKSPEIEAHLGSVKGSPSKFKLPTFKFPKFGVATPNVSAEVPSIDKDIKIEGADMDISVPQTGVDVPGVKVEVNLPEVQVKKPSADVVIEQPSIEVDGKLKKQRFSMPKFSFSKSSVKVPEVDASLPDVTVAIPEGKVDLKGDVDVKLPECEAEVEGSKFKMPKFGITMPNIKGPEIDLSLSKKDVDVTLPEVKGEVKLPEVELKEPSAKMEIKAPGIDVQTSNVEGSPSKMKMPTFKFPKFGVGSPKVSVEVPDVDKDIKIEGGTVDITAPSIDTGDLSVDMKVKGGEVEGPGSKFKMPKFGISLPKVKGPEIDVSLPKKDVDVTLPEAEVQLPDVELKQPSAAVEIKAPGIDVKTSGVEGSPSKMKMPTFKFPKFGVGSPKVSVEVPDVDKDVTIEGGTVDITAPSIDTEGLSVDMKVKGGEVEASGSKFKMPKFGISLPKVKGPEIDLSLPKTDVDVTLPEAKAEVQLPDVEIKPPSATVEIKGPEIEGNIEGSPSKLKMPSFTLPKFGVGSPKVSVEVPDVDKDIKIEGGTVDITAPSIDAGDLSVDMKVKGGEVEGSKFKMPKFGISLPKVKGPEIDVSLSKVDVDIAQPEVKAEVELPGVEVKTPESAISAPDAPTVDVETKSKRANWSFPKFSFSRSGGKTPDVDVTLETPKVDVTTPEIKAEVTAPSLAISTDDSPVTELDASLKKSKFSLPKFSFAKSSSKESEITAEPPRVDISLPEGEVIVKQPEIKMKAPELEVEHDGQGSKFKLPNFGIALPKVKGSEDDSNQGKEVVSITSPEVKAEVKLPEVEVKESAASETEIKTKDIGGSPLKFKMPTMQMPKFGAAADVTVEASTAETEAKLKEDITLNIKGPSVDIKMDTEAKTDSEKPKTESDTAGLGSPSKFKLPLFKMPVLGFSRSETSPADAESKEGMTVELKAESKSPKAESKSPKAAFTSFGEILKNIDVEFDVPKTPDHLESPKEVTETEEKKKETKQESTKSPERTGWFKFPKFGLSSPSSPAKSPEKVEKSPLDEEISPTCSIQSSDAFADISSAMTSEHVGVSLSSPTKVMVKYSDPSHDSELGEMHSNVITSTTRTEMISVEPNLPEKITILSSGLSSSSEDTLRLNSGKIHVITSNIQATPESQQAKIMTAVQIQSVEGLPQESSSTASWTVGDSQGGKRSVFERRVVRETSSERSESKETIVITKQITRVVNSSEPISGETASSIQRLKDSVHSEKMRFFDGADE